MHPTSFGNRCRGWFGAAQLKLQTTEAKLHVFGSSDAWLGTRNISGAPISPERSQRRTKVPKQRCQWEMGR
eukprot:1247184-Alexandrium_andersonii.AAC.1